MDNEKNIPSLPDLDGIDNETWLNELLSKPLSQEEIVPDENAVTSAGLTHPDDLELEKILAENWDDVPDLEQPEAPAQAPAVEAAEAAPQPEEAPAPVAEKVAPAQPDAVSQPVEQTRMFQVPQEPAPAPAPQTTQKIDVLLSEDEDEPDPQQPDDSSGKGRPKAKEGYGFLGIPHILSTAIWLAIILAVGITLGRAMWVVCADLMAFGKPSQKVTITITEEDSLESVSDKLGKAGLVRYPGLFKLFAQLTGKDERISEGTFVLNANLDYNAMINAMTASAQNREVVTVMIPEGYTCAQIFKLLEEKNICSAADLEAYCAEGQLDEYWFLEGVARGDKYCLEGYLFPDTYDFYTNEKPRTVLEKLLDAFDARFTSTMKDKLQPLNDRLAKVLRNRGYSEEYIESHKITIREIVIIASMIEKETSGAEESYVISSVIYNRLTNPANYLYLNIDATLIYYLGGNIDPETGKTKPLTQADLDNDHPYNSYTRPGLIPGPISNPGQSSLDAALEPESTDYYYYVYNPHAGEHLFAKNEDDHEDNIDYVASLG